MIKATVICDSISESGVRLTTMQVRFHRFVLSEFNTHRMFSRNFSSSRAIPVARMIEQVENDPALPGFWGKNRAGMQADEAVFDSKPIRETYHLLKEVTLNAVQDMVDNELHKQTANRFLEPFMWVNGVVTATEWGNFFKLRLHPAAQPEMQALAASMRDALEVSTPRTLTAGEWHLPYINMDDRKLVSAIYPSGTVNTVLRMMSAARCARVSYNKHDGSSPSIEDDLELYNQLVTRPHTDKRGFEYGVDDPIHASPLEHQATPMQCPTFRPEDPIDISNSVNGKGKTHIDTNGNWWSGNFKHWIQHRHTRRIVCTLTQQP